jgi:hypothetical protein
MGCALITKMWEQWRGRWTQTWTTAEFYRSACCFWAYTMPFFSAHISKHD